jgi:hypothetical protein
MRNPVCNICYTARRETYHATRYSESGEKENERCMSSYADQVCNDQSLRHLQVLVMAQMLQGVSLTSNSVMYLLYGENVHLFLPSLVSCCQKCVLPAQRVLV